MAVAFRLAYTAYSRRHEPCLGYGLANQQSLGLVSELSEDSLDAAEVDDQKDTISCLKQVDDVYGSECSDTETPETSLTFGFSAVNGSGGYITNRRTVLQMAEATIPQRARQFTVSEAATGSTIFYVERPVASLHHRQELVDARTGQSLFSINRRIGQLPISHQFLDSRSGACVLDLRGGFFVPFTGAKATAYTLDETRSHGDECVAYTMTGSWKNRHAQVVDGSTGATLASMKSSFANVKTLAGGRRTYTVTIEKGVNAAMVVGMLVALDARTA